MATMYEGCRCIVQVQLVQYQGDQLINSVDLHLDGEELQQYKDQAMQAIECHAFSMTLDTPLKRMVYCDDAGDWCTLNKDTLADALDFAVPVAAEDGMVVKRLTVRVCTEKDVAAASQEPNVDVARPPVPPQMEEPQVALEDAWAQLALRELNRVAAGADLRQLVPKLAERALRVLDEVRLAELLPLAQPLVDLRDGTLRAEGLPKVLPQMAAMLKHLPSEAREQLGERLRHEAEMAREEAAEEQANGKDVEVHQGVVCDGCETTPIMGSRFKSLTLDDYDLCGACFHSCERDPRAWARVTSGIYGRVVSSFYAPPATEVAEGKAVHHNVQCDVCASAPIIGDRYRCLDLPDFDVCERCYPTIPNIADLANMRFKKVPLVSVEGQTLKAFEVAEAEVEQAAATAQEEPEAPQVFDIEELKLRAQELDEAALADALRSLLEHANPAVREAAVVAVLQQAAARAQAAAAFAAAAEEDLPVEPEAENSEEQEQFQEEQQMQEDEHIPQEDEEQMQEEHVDQEHQEDEPEMLASGQVTPATDASEWLMLDQQVEAPEPPTPQPSACIVSSDPLIVGIEAQEDNAARGDVSEELGELLRASGARQAYRAGRVAIPTNQEGVPVPACAKFVVVNNGQVPWPRTATMCIAAGDAFDFPHLELGTIRPGEAAEVIMDLLIPARSEPSAVRSTWAITDSASGALLGPLLFFEVQWVAA